jgi:hypothetical protein
MTDVKCYRNLPTVSLYHHLAMPFHMPFVFYLFLYFFNGNTIQVLVHILHSLTEFLRIDFSHEHISYSHCNSKASLHPLWMSKARIVNSKIAQS